MCALRVTGELISACVSCYKSHIKHSMKVTHIYYPSLSFTSRTFFILYSKLNNLLVFGLLVDNKKSMTVRWKVQWLKLVLKKKTTLIANQLSIKLLDKIHAKFVDISQCMQSHVLMYFACCSNGLNVKPKTLSAWVLWWFNHMESCHLSDVSKVN